MTHRTRDSLFPQAVRPPRLVAAELAVVVAVLVSNGLAATFQVSMALTVAGLALLALECRHGLNRLRPAALWVGLAMLGGLLAQEMLAVSREHAWALGSRIACGLVWILWLSTRTDWRSVRAMLHALGVPEVLVASMDQSIQQGSFTAASWRRHRGSAQLRLGGTRLPLAAWPSIIGAGALAAFERAEWADRQSLQRSASSREHLPDAFCCELANVSLGHDGHWRLRDLSFVLAPGEWIALCGPSGAGKSTLLQLLAGLHGTDAGTYRRFGQDLTARQPLRRRLDGRVGLLCQNPEHHFIASTVGEDIGWGLKHRGVGEGEVRERVTQMADSLGLSGLLDAPCHQLSFGEQRRVALAGVLVLEPALLLLDEPTAGLDPVAAAELMAQVRSALALGRGACIWATHDHHALPADVKRGVLMRDGALVFDGPIAQALSPHWLDRAGLLPPEDWRQYRSPAA